MNVDVSTNVVEENHFVSGCFLFAAVAGWLILAGVSKIAYAPPTPVASSAPNDVFSAERAEVYLEQLVGDGIPHPAGSEQNKIVADRVKSILQSFGYKVDEQLGERKLKFRRTENDLDILTLRNLVAIKPGNSELGSVLLACHYDSVPFGPGAADDGVAVAALLEIARMARSALDGGREVIFLFTDGEEFGLLGADVFVRENALVDRVEFVVNLEARGTSGPSLMFQTSSDSKQMLEILARSVRNPVTSSVFEEVYKRMPNDTDFTIFRDEAKMRGFNFAFIGDARNYHTPEDNLANSSRGSLQHHGDNTWGLLKTLVDLPDLPADDQKVVYFDFYAMKIIYWDRDLTFPGSLVLVAFFVFWAFLIRKDLDSRSMAKSALVVFIASLVIGVVCWLIQFSYRFQNRFNPPWVDYPEVIAFSFWALAMAASLYSLNRLKCDATTLGLVVWVVWLTIGIFTSIFVVGASYLFLIPAAVGIFLNIVLARYAGVASFLATLVAAAWWMPIGLLFYDAIGFSVVAVTVLRIVLLNMSLLPLAAAASPQSVNQLGAVLFVLGVASTIAGVFLNPIG